MLHEPRHRRRQANQERILEAATHIVQTEGVEGLSIKKVADVADYTPGALYRYFPSKDALLAAVVVRIIGELEGELRAANARATSPLSRIVGQAIAYCEFARRSPHGFGLLTQLIAEPRVLIEGARDAQTIAGAMTRALLPLAAALDAAAAANTLATGDISERALLMWSALQGTLQLRKQERIAPQLIDTDRMCIAMVRTLLMGWGASLQPVDQAITEALSHINIETNP